MNHHNIAIFVIFEKNNIMKNSIILFCFFFSLAAIGQELQPTEENALLHVYVHNLANGDTMQNRTIKITGEKSGKTFEGTTGAKAVFDVLIPEGDKYDIEFKGMLGNTEHANIEIPNVEGLVNFNFDIKLELKQSITLDNVYFDVNSAKLKPESYVALNNFAAGMKVIKSLKVEVQGHTDSDGDDESNLVLSQKRAQSVIDYVASQGVDKSRMTAKGYGETKPIASNDTAEGKAKNRRTEVKVISK